METTTTTRILQLAREWAGTLNQATEHRDQLIIEAHAEGASLRRIADAVGLSHQTVANIIERTG